MTISALMLLQLLPRRQQPCILWRIFRIPCSCSLMVPSKPRQRSLSLMASPWQVLPFRQAATLHWFISPGQWLCAAWHNRHDYQYGNRLRCATCIPTDSFPYPLNTAAPNLSIVKGICPAQIAENGRVTYYLGLTNYGNTATSDTDRVQITDTFSPLLSNLSVSYNGYGSSRDELQLWCHNRCLFYQPGIINIPAATYVQNPTTGAYTLTPGTATVTVTGNI